MAIITILIIIMVCWILFSTKKKNGENKLDVEQSNQLKATKASEEEEIFVDDGGRFRIVKKERALPRKTYLLGTLYGKYWGEIDPDKANEYLRQKFFDFHIYEAEVTNAELSQTEFDCISDYSFPKERLPLHLHTIINNNGKKYAINIHEPKIWNVKFISKLHQTDGKEIYGTIEAKLTGYILDFVREDYTEKEYLLEFPKKLHSTSPVQVELTRTQIPTGNVELKSGYERVEYYFSDYKTRYWGDWIYKKSTSKSISEGCLSFAYGFIGTLIGITFLILLLPRIVVFLPFLLIPFLLRLIPEKAWLVISRTFVGLFIVGLIISILQAFSNDPKTYIPKPVVKDAREEAEPIYDPVIDTAHGMAIVDTMITHFRSWQDYSGRLYEGKFGIKISDLTNASSFKNSLNLTENSKRIYDEIIYRLKENDKNGLQGLYNLFDSLQKSNKLNAEEFAEMVVSFVQDMPYSLVLPFACDPSIYADKFISNYLSSKDALCDDFERFGIKSPVEFLASLRGDCDSRTLLIYAILSHYDFDVAVLSSEHYNHSLIGVNLPYVGLSFRYNQQRYVLWETTAPNVRPGVLPNEISNLAYWRISLKSK